VGLFSPRNVQYLWNG